MFLGEFSHNIDDKGRMSIPSKFRDDLGEVFYVTKGFDKCLFVFPEEEWKVFQEKLKNLPLSSRDARSLVRFFYAGAMECSLDKQGRINLGSKLREHAGIEKEVSVIGVDSRIEIWSRQSWESYSEPENIDYDDIAEQLQL